MNWLEKIIAMSVKIAQVEVFLDEDGNALEAGGGDYVGQDDHELAALKRAIEGTLDDREVDQLEVWEVESLTPEQQQRVNEAFPGFVEHMLGGGCCKRFCC